MVSAQGKLVRFNRFGLFLIYSAYVMALTGIMFLCLKWAGVEFSLDFASDYFVTFGYSAVCLFVVCVLTLLTDVEEGNGTLE